MDPRLDRAASQVLADSLDISGLPVPNHADLKFPAGRFVSGVRVLWRIALARGAHARRTRR